MPQNPQPLPVVSVKVSSGKKSAVAAALPDVVTLVAALAPILAKASYTKRRELLAHNPTFAAIVEPLISTGLLIL